MECVKILNVSKFYKTTRALNNIKLTIKKNRIVGLIGPNGSGKTTLLRLITGLTKPSNGEVIVSENVEGIIEKPALYGKLSGYENLKLKMELCDNIDKKRIHEVVSLLGLENRINDRVKTYSLGMRQRLSIAMALLSDPQILILDEPMNGLDPSGMKELTDILLKLNKEKRITIIISSHLLNRLEEISDELVFIRNGNILLDYIVEEKIDIEKIYFDLMEGNRID